MFTAALAKVPILLIAMCTRDEVFVKAEKRWKKQIFFLETFTRELTHKVVYMWITTLSKWK